MPNPILEICAASVASAINAQEGGAHRIELCDNLCEGGTTPSYGMIRAARKQLKIKLHILIRPRGSDFIYTGQEMDIIREDVIQCKALGVDGIVTGFLLPDGNIDMERTNEIAELAHPLSVTFHRAFDMAKDPFLALSEIRRARIDRILTSGQKNNAVEGKELIRDLVGTAGDDIIIMAGAGLNEDNILEFARYTRAREFHATLRSHIQSRMLFRRDDIRMGSMDTIPEYEMAVCDPDRVRKVRMFLGRLNTLSLQP